MSKKVISYSFGDNFIKRLADHIEADYFNEKMDLQDIENCYCIYKLAKKEIPRILEGRDTFPRFIAWGREIISFIDQMDLEDISNDELKNIQDNAQAGYEVPKSINELLAHIVLIRIQYHEFLEKEKMFSKGTLALFAAEKIDRLAIPEFDKVFFCNFFDLKKTQKRIIKYLLDKELAQVFFQAQEKSCPELEALAQYFGENLVIDRPVKSDYKLQIYSGFDMHSQIGVVREIIKKKQELDKTVIVLPYTDSVVPLLSEISDFGGDFNVSMGYPVQRSSLFTLFSYIINAQQTKKGGAFYARDYLKVIKHPFIKNLKFKQQGQLTRILVHKIEDFLTGAEDSELGGSLFIELSEIENLKMLKELVFEQSGKISAEITQNDISYLLREIHKYAFDIWKDIENLGDLSRVLEEFTRILLEKSFLDVYALNLKIAEQILAMADEFAGISFAAESFSVQDILRIFEDKLKAEKISFTGAPLKGLQVLGLFETRSLDFENVIIMDVNESVLPKLKIHEPLIPRQVMMNLGFNQLELEDAIQRYHFMRLISSAKNVSLIYNNSPEKQRSRFIEELVWREESEQGKLDVLPIIRASFDMSIQPSFGSISKTPKVLKVLKEFTYSPSSINTYLNCPLQFYYQNVLSLKEQEDLLEEPQSRQIGNFMHKLLEDTFLKFIHSRPIIDERFKLIFFKEFDKRFEAEFSQRMKSDAFMLKYIMRYRLEKFLECEKARCGQVEQILGLEMGVDGVISFQEKKGSFKCRLDRVEKLEDESILVIDYKTGNADNIPKSAQKLRSLKDMDRQSIQRSIVSFQLPVYTYFMRKQYPGLPVASCLYSLKNQEMNFFPRKNEQGELEALMETCLKALEFIIDEINNPEIPFESASDAGRNCEFCEFSIMCK
ncbi:MAG: PD-(D/E)XK nuclease family protein [Candidatus Omnitrophica bacterium]|nr:PD-(D/E)XK nuclease family protein [Candidatus Omnitrophota bacterium]